MQPAKKPHYAVLAQANFAVHAAFLQVCCHIKTVRLIADNNRINAVGRALLPQHSTLEQRPSAAHIHRLLGLRLARERPQLCAATAAQNDRQYCA